MYTPMTAATGVDPGAAPPPTLTLVRCKELVTQAFSGMPLHDLEHTNCRSSSATLAQPRSRRAANKPRRRRSADHTLCEQRTFPAALLAVFAELSDGLSTRVQVTAPGAAAGAAAAPANAPRTQSTSISATATYLMWPTSTPAPRC